MRGLFELGMTNGTPLAAAATFSRSTREEIRGLPPLAASRRQQQKNRSGKTSRRATTLICYMFIARIRERERGPNNVIRSCDSVAVRSSIKRQIFKPNAAPALSRSLALFGVARNSAAMYTCSPPTHGITRRARAHTRTRSVCLSANCSISRRYFQSECRRRPSPPPPRQTFTQVNVNVTRDGGIIGSGRDMVELLTRLDRTSENKCRSSCEIARAFGFDSSACEVAFN
jgi:hypothetical protein